MRAALMFTLRDSVTFPMLLRTWYSQVRGWNHGTCFRVRPGTRNVLPGTPRNTTLPLWDEGAPSQNRQRAILVLGCCLATSASSRPWHLRKVCRWIRIRWQFSILCVGANRWPGFYSEDLVSCPVKGLFGGCLPP